jgi:transcriptional regulator with XRE-family HTH domain
MSRKSFSQKDVERSAILKAVSANLELIRRLEDLSMAEFANMVGVSDRFLDELIRQKTNVSILVLEKIASRLGLPLMTLIGTRLEVRIPGAETGFLRSLQDESRRHAGQLVGEPLFHGHRPASQEPPVLSGDQNRLNALLTNVMESQNQILQNQVALNKRLAELDTWLSDNSLRHWPGRPAAMQ